MTERAAGPREPVRIALIGFMGSGKSTVGALLAGMLGWDFADLDALAEAEAGCPVAELFAARGEEAFRRLESACLRGLAGRGKVVIATGGGAPLRTANGWLFRDAGTAVLHLHVTLDEALARTRGDTSRPLLANEPDEVRRLYEARLPRYRNLGIEIATDGRTPEDIAADIAARLFPSH